MQQGKRIAIVWAPHEARTALYAQIMGAELRNVSYIAYKRPLVAPIKYILQWFKTWSILMRERPSLVYVTNPPPLAPACVAIYCRLTRTQFIMDTHSPALYDSKWGWSRPFQKFIAQFPTINIVDQERFKKLFDSWGVRNVVLTRPPVTLDFDALPKPAKQDEFAITYVGTFTDDEPVGIIIEAAKQLPEVKFYITGNPAMAKREWIEGAPSNVEFTGYLLKENFWSRLYHSRAVLVLTTYPHSIVGGGDDSVAVKRPLIVSDQPAIREFFTKGTIYIQNTVESLVAGIRKLQAEEPRYRQEMEDFNAEYDREWRARLQKLEDFLVEDRAKR